MDKGDAPFLNWDNGPGPSDYWMRDICKKYHTDIEFRGKQGSHAWHVVGKDLVPGRTVSDVWRGPAIRLHELKINGPLPRTYQSRAQQVFLDGERDLAKVNLELAFTRFARRAFRRPVSNSEIEPYLKIENHARLKLGRSPEDAFFLALKAMLVSPDFLYLKEEKRETNRLNSFETANRLSHFLWSSLPDNELFQLAKNEKLRDRAVFKQQIEPAERSAKSGLRRWVCRVLASTRQTRHHAARLTEVSGILPIWITGCHARGNSPVPRSCDQGKRSLDRFHPLRLRVPQSRPRPSLRDQWNRGYPYPESLFPRG